MCREAGAAGGRAALWFGRGAGRRSRPPRTAAGPTAQVTSTGSAPVAGACRPAQRTLGRALAGQRATRRRPLDGAARDRVSERFGGRAAAWRSTSASSGNAGASAAAAAARRDGGATARRASAGVARGGGTRSGAGRTASAPAGAVSPVQCSCAAATSASSASTAARRTRWSGRAPAVEHLQPGQHRGIADLHPARAGQLAEHRRAHAERLREPALGDPEPGGQPPHPVAERRAVQLALAAAVAGEAGAQACCVQVGRVQAGSVRDGRHAPDARTRGLRPEAEREKSVIPPADELRRRARPGCGRRRS